MAESLRARRVFPYVAWGTLVFNVFVILWGTVVRATGSGDGCGESWPKCGQQFIPPNPTVETMIEFSHRVSSFLAGVGVAAMFFLALWAWPKRHLVRKAATVSGIFIVVEALLGAALVLFGWVDADVSVARMIVVPLHLANTFMLLGAIAVTAWWGSGFRQPDTEGKSRSIRWLWVGFAIMMVLGGTGALNALADTIFPANSVAEGIADEFGSTAPMLLRLRIIHPILAIGGGLLLGWLTADIARKASRTSKRFAAAVSIIVLSQFFIGIANIFFLTPLAIQVLHLMVADLLWLAFVFFSVSWLGDSIPVRAREPASS
ncbi:MAG: COX15/CtaA family protein [Actinomycetota bacterium]